MYLDVFSPASHIIILETLGGVCGLPTKSSSCLMKNTNCRPNQININCRSNHDVFDEKYKLPTK